MKPSYDDKPSERLIKAFVIMADWAVNPPLAFRNISFTRGPKSNLKWTWEEIIRDMASWMTDETTKAALVVARQFIVSLFRYGPPADKELPSDLRVAAALEYCREKLGWEESHEKTEA